MWNSGAIATVTSPPPSEPPARHHLGVVDDRLVGVDRALRHPGRARGVGEEAPASRVRPPTARARIAGAEQVLERDRARAVDAARCPASAAGTASSKSSSETVTTCSTAVPSRAASTTANSDSRQITIRAPESSSWWRSSRSLFIGLTVVTIRRRSASPRGRRSPPAARSAASAPPARRGAARARRAAPPPASVCPPPPRANVDRGVEVEEGGLVRAARAGRARTARRRHGQPAPGGQ